MTDTKPQFRPDRQNRAARDRRARDAAPPTRRYTPQELSVLSHLLKPEQAHADTELLSVAQDADESSLVLPRNRLSLPSIGTVKPRTIALSGLCAVAVSFTVWSFVGANESSSRPAPPPIRKSDNRQPATGNRQPATGNRQPTTDNRQPATDSQSVHLPDKEPPELQTPPNDRAAVDLLIAGRYREALGVYNVLAGQRPDQPVYPAIARILQFEIAPRCQGRGGKGDKSCSTSQ